MNEVMNAVIVRCGGADIVYGIPLGHQLLYLTISCVSICPLTADRPQSPVIDIHAHAPLFCAGSSPTNWINIHHNAVSACSRGTMNNTLCDRNVMDIRHGTWESPSIFCFNHTFCGPFSGDQNTNKLSKLAIIFRLRLIFNEKC